MTWYQSLLLGLVEGFTEYLPISSTGHLILSSWLLGFASDPERWTAAFNFNIIIQCGAILAVLVVYRTRCRSLLGGLLGRDREGARIGRHVLLAFVPAAMVGPIVEEAITVHLNGPWPVVLALFVGAAPLFAVGWWYGDRPQSAGRGLEAMGGRLAFFIGCAQCVAMWPGMSRSMTTIVAGIAGGLTPAASAEFSFLLGLLTLTAATAFSLADSGTEVMARFGFVAVVVGVGAATISAALSVRWLVRFLTIPRLALFGWYRVLVAALLIVVLLRGGGK